MSYKTKKTAPSRNKQTLPHGKILGKPSPDAKVSIPMHTIGKILAKNPRAKLTMEPDGKGFILIPMAELEEFFELKVPMQNVIIVGAREEIPERPQTPPGPPPESPLGEEGSWANES